MVGPAALSARPLCGASDLALDLRRAYDCLHQYLKVLGTGCSTEMECPKGGEAQSGLNRQTQDAC